MDTTSNILLHVYEASSARRPPMNQEEFDSKHGFIVRSEQKQWHAPFLNAFSSHVPKSSNCSRKSTSAAQHLQFEEPPKMRGISLPTTMHTNSRTTIWDSHVFRLLPIIGSIRDYDWRDGWSNDLLVGASVGMQCASDGIAMTLVAGLPPLVGLYSSIFAMFIYLIFGTSARNYLGMNLVICHMTRSIIEAHSTAYDHRYTLVGEDIYETNGGEVGENGKSVDVWELAEIVSTITFISAVTYAVIHVSRADFLFNYLPTHIADGLVFGVVIRVTLGQFGRNALAVFESGGVLEGAGRESWLECLGSLSRCVGNVDYYSTGLFSISIALLLGLHRLSAVTSRPHRGWYTPPADFKFLLFASLASHLFMPAERLGVVAFGPVNNALIAPTLPRFNLIPSVLADSWAIALLAFCMHRQLSRTTIDGGSRVNVHGDPTHLRQELLAFTLIGAISSFLGLIPVSDSETRVEVVRKSLKDASRLACIPSVLVMAITLLLLPTLLQPLPVCVLSAVVIFGALRCGYWRVAKTAKELWNTGPSVDSLSFIITSAVAALCDSPAYVLIASVVVAVLSIALRSQWAPCEVLLNAGVGSSAQYVEKSEYNCDDAVDADEPGLAVVSYRAHVLFHNAHHFKTALLRACDNISGQLMRVGIGTRTSSVKSASASLMIEMFQQQQPRTILSLDSAPMNEEQISRALVLDCSPISAMDTAGMESLMEAFDELESTRKARLLLACVNASLRREFEQAGGFKRIPKRYFFPSVHDAVIAAQQLGSGAGGTLFIHNSVSLNGCRETITLSAAHSQHSHINDNTSHVVQGDTVSVQSIPHPLASSTNPLQSQPPIISITTPQPHYAVARASLPAVALRDGNLGARNSES